MDKIFLVVFTDNPLEILSAWSTREGAEGDIKRLLAETESGPTYYWLQNRLSIKEMTVNAPAEHP